MNRILCILAVWLGCGWLSLCAQDYPDISDYPFLDLDANAIAMNGDDWYDLRELFSASGDTVISIVHIGDSHIQAEGSTSRTRALLQEEYGSAGRGLILPYRIAGTNQPADYSIKSDSRFTTAKLMKQPWPIPMGFTGIALQPLQQNFSFTISVNRRPGSEPDFDIIKMFAQGKMPRLKAVKDAKGFDTLFSDFAKGDTLEIFINEPAESVTLEFESRGKCQIFGFLLENQMTGIEYSAIGHNSATYSAYNTLGLLPQNLKSLNPSLIIVSMGTNEAFGNASIDAIYNNIDVFVSALKRENPQAKILLTTPAESQKSKWARSAKTKKRYKTYAPNPKVAQVRNAILRYGRDKGIPTYDFYAVAGGEGSSAKWLKEGLLKKDRVHNTEAGYSLMGEFLFIALQRALQYK